MPEISRFFGIVIKMYFDEHPPPHFHAEYGEQEALIDIRTLAIISGQLSPRALGLVMEWLLFIKLNSEKPGKGPEICSRLVKSLP